MAKNPSSTSSKVNSVKASMAKGGKAFKGNKPQPGNTGPRFSKGGMVKGRKGC